MAKTSDERINEALVAIEENAGHSARQYVENRLPASPVTLATWSTELSLGGGPVHGDKEKSRRRLVRGVLLAYMAADTSGFRRAMVVNALKKESAGELAARLRKFLPSTQICGNFSARTTWDPGRFTDPNAHNTGAFRYIITGVVKAPVKISQRGFLASQQEADDFVKYLTKFPPDILTIEDVGKGAQKREVMSIKPAIRYLRDPNLLRYDIISTSVINHEHVATYFPWGFILRVPPENIVSAACKDQAVKNRPNNVITEMQKMNTDHGLATPDEVLAATSGKNGDTGYNEVVVIGRSPEGKLVDVAGIFVKVAPNNNLYIRNRPGEDAAYVADLINEIQACGRQHGIPIVNIPDSSSKPSTTAWPF